MYENRVHFKFLFGPICVFPPSSPSDTHMIVFMCVEESTFSQKRSRFASCGRVCCQTPLYTSPFCLLMHSNGKIKLTMEIYSTTFPSYIVVAFLFFSLLKAAEIRVGKSSVMDNQQHP